MANEHRHITCIQYNMLIATGNTSPLLSQRVIVTAVPSKIVSVIGNLTTGDSHRLTAVVYF